MAIKSAQLTESSSLLLDIIRLSAALLVVVAHLSRPEFAVVTTRNLQFLGDFAVPVFFVLSGFVIRFVTTSREHTLRAYLIDRASRIYSIALPAMALTLAVAAICFFADRPYFEREIAPIGNHALLRVALNLTFLSQSWGFNTVQFANSPFWSLSYECMFYVAYGLVFYLRGVKRVVALLAWAAAGGPPILFLFPLWLLGCLLYDVYRTIRQKPVAVFLRTVTILYATLAVALAASGHNGLLRAPIRLDAAIASLPNPFGLAHLVSSRATMLAIGHGTLAAGAMLLLLLLADLWPLARNHPFARRFRRLADGTFAIYLMHYPLMMLARATGLLRPDAHLLNGVTVVTIVLASIAVAGPLDRFKSTLRHALQRTRVPWRAHAVRPFPSLAVGPISTLRGLARSQPSADGNPQRRPLRSPAE